ncbi:peptide deformylase 1A, chloroplastic [Tanacetum coccineum]
MWPLTNSRIELLRTLFRRCPERRELADSKWVEHYNVCLMIVVTGDMDDRWRWDIIALAWGLFGYFEHKTKEKSNKTASLLQKVVQGEFDGLVCVFGYEAMVERFLEVEVTGLDQDGQPIKVDASGWQARILQHECDHLDGILYVDKMEKQTFGTVLNHKLPLAKGWPQQRVR